MSVSLAPFIRFREVDNNGLPLAGGKLYSYQAGTTTPQATYTDSTGVTPNANPVILDASGRASVWLDVSLSYKFVLTDSSNNQIWSEDGIIGLASNNSIPTAALQDGSVTTVKLADDAVTSAKLQDSPTIDANRAVTSDHIRNAAVNITKMDASTTTENSDKLNLGFLVSIAANALTFALKTKAGSNPSATDIVTVGMRDSTATSGVYLTRSITSALSLVIPSGTTIGTISGAIEDLIWGLIDNAGTLELVVGCGVNPDEGSLISTSAIAGGATRGVWYSTTARSNVALRVIGRTKVTEASAGTWSSAPSENAIAPFNYGPRSEVFVYGAATSASGTGLGSTNTYVRRFLTTGYSSGVDITYTDSATLGGFWTINTNGIYALSYSDKTAAGTGNPVITQNSSTLTSAVSAGSAFVLTPALDFSVGVVGAVYAVVYLKAGDVIRAQDVNTNSRAASANKDIMFRITKVSN